MSEIKPNEFVVVKLNYFELNEKGKKVNYFMLSDDEINAIYEIEDVDNRKLLLYFASLKSRINKSSKNGKEGSGVTYSSMLEMTTDVGLISYESGSTLVRKNKEGELEFYKGRNVYALGNDTKAQMAVRRSIDEFNRSMRVYGWTTAIQEF